MKHKPESYSANSETGAAGSSTRRSLTRAGLHLGQLSHVVSGALSTLQGGTNARGAAQNRMRALLNQDRALLSHRAFGQAEPEDVEAPEVPVRGSQTRGAAQNRMRELLNQDRALLALRQAKGLEDHDELELGIKSEPGAHDFAATAVAAPAAVAEPAAVRDASLARGHCVGVTTSFVAEPSVSTVCTPGPVPTTAAAAVVVQAAPAPAPVVVVAPQVVGVSAPPSQPTAKTINSETEGNDPIRTRGMAKLLAMQGYKDRALSIYDELIAAEPDNAALRAEADRLRS
jgi:hypothetical protein